ncbi:hypothetical protein D2T29_12285 [Sinirhodobacter populi]|uniref:Uncharacterized protein n=1 Tax=Paenirhodobacter populi TaxID=2306993 RepID=A0A443KCC9_9RHOB|nr:hypothetical protein [Sinirhodobacter populi]RWR30444.1 hypothetical protein D2T29_12285 [Sinirhodobacter populi]
MTFPLPLPALNCLSQGMTIDRLVKAERIETFEVAYCRNESERGDETYIQTCLPSQAEFATIYGRADTGEAIAIHDAELSPEGAAELAAITAALFVAINENRVA